MKTLITKASLLIAVAVLSGSTGNFLLAQESHFCGTDEMMLELLKTNPDAKNGQEELEAFTKEYVRTHPAEATSERGGPQYVIPIVFHIVHDRGIENVSDNTIYASVAILNKDYQRLNSDTGLNIAPQFRGMVADCNIEFRLAQIDPYGNCTNGIDRIYSYRTYQGDDRGKLGIWDRRNYLNIWVVNRISDGNVAAYAYLPGGAAGLGYKVDGVLVRYNYVGTDPTNGRTLTHEIGHSFNLMHPWGGGQVATACGDDGVLDTPPTEGGISCPSNKVDFSCSKDSIRRNWQFDNVTQSSGTTEPNTPIAVTNAHGDTALTLMNFTAVGVAANSSVDSVFGFAGWDTGGANGDTTYANQAGTMNTAKYYEFKVRPQLGQGMSLTGIRFKIKRSPTGPRTFAFRSSQTVPSFSSNITASVIPANPNLSIRGTTTPNNFIFYFNNDTNNAVLSGCRVTLNGTAYTNTDDTVAFRIYAWNAEDTLGTFEIDSVAVIGMFGTVENLDNYMDYTYCHHMFTPGQSERMHAALESSVSSRNNLWSAQNHALTGIDNPQTCVPQADFYVKKSMSCQNGASIQFFDYSSRGTATGWSWSFPGGTPSTSTQQNPTVVFNTLWSQTVTLTVSNAAGSSTITKDNSAWIAPNWADYSGIYSEDFEDASRFNSAWRVDNVYSNSSVWQLTDAGTFPSGTHGLKLNAFSPMVISTNTTPPVILDPGIGGYDKDAFITPALDLSHVTNGQLQFKISAATRASVSSDMTDTLRLYYSINCGNTWSFITKYSGSSLSNAGSFQDSYTPSVQTQWAQKTINLTLAMTSPNVRFKFEYTSGDKSNNIYIDDVNISGTVGIENNSPSISADLSVFPNPAGEDATVSYRLSAPRNVKLQVFDAIGNLVYELINQKQSAGSYSVSFNTSKISNGIYHVNLIGDNVTLKTEKLVVIK